MASYIARSYCEVKSLFGLVHALGGDPHTGRAHDGKSATSLHVDEAKGLAYCFAGCSFEEVLNAARDRGWTGDSSFAPKDNPTVRSKAQRRAWALEILHEVDSSGGYYRAQKLLPEYFLKRALTKVPPTAMLAVSCQTLKNNPAMVFEVTSDGLNCVDAHVTWLAPNKKTKRNAEPYRQCYGPVGGGFIQLFEGELDPTSKLVIAEGIETAAAASQIAGGLPAIAAMSANNLPKINPPIAAEYIIAADNDRPGLDGARALVAILVRKGFKVRLAIPNRANTDWNDFLQEGLADGTI